MTKTKYQLPNFLNNKCDPETFEKWLERKARTHAKRDKKRGYENATRSNYKEKIYDAVEKSEGKDFYTGEELNWELIGKYDNES